MSIFGDYKQNHRIANRENLSYITSASYNTQGSADSAENVWKYAIFYGRNGHSTPPPVFLLVSLSMTKSALLDCFLCEDKLNGSTVGRMENL